MMTERLLMALLLSLSLLAGERDPKRLVVGCNIGNAPYEFVDASGRPAGYVIDLIQEVARNQGLELTFRPLPFGELRAAFERREVDVLPGFIHSEERAKQAAFSIPTCDLDHYFIVRRDDRSIRSERDLAGKRLLVMQGSIWEEYLKVNGILPLYPVKSHEEALRGIARDQGDFTLMPRFCFLHLSRALGLTNLREVPSDYFPAKFCFAVHPEATQLLARLNEGLLEAKQNGRMDALYERHLGRLEAEVLPEPLLQRKLRGLLPGALAVGLALSLLWLLTLQRLVQVRTAALREELANRQAAVAQREVLLEEVRAKNRELEGLARDLEAAMAQVKQLRGLLPLCPTCKRIRNDLGFWQAVEEYVTTHSEAQFSHGLCPACIRVYFPDEERGKGQDPAQDPSTRET